MSLTSLICGTFGIEPNHNRRRIYPTTLNPSIILHFRSDGYELDTLKMHGNKKDVSTNHFVEQLNQHCIALIV